MHFSFKENEKSLRWTCLTFKDTHLCIIPDHLNKLCREIGYNIGHLAWKPWIFIHDSSFLRTLFQDICIIPSLYFFLDTMSHKMTQCQGFPFFCFFQIVYADFKRQSKLLALPFISKDGILKNSWWISDEIDIFISKNIFYKK